MAGRLYDPRDNRMSSDVDLLIDPATVDQARRVMQELGFRDDLAEAAAQERADHSSHWLRDRPLAANVDLHTALSGCTDDPPALWRELSHETDELKVAGENVEVLSDPGQAFVLALHVVHHGLARKPGEDLRRALVVYDAQTWRTAAGLARRLNAATAFAVGLAQLPAGRNVVKELGLRADPTPQMVLSMSGAPSASAGLARLAASASHRERAQMVVRELFPTPAFMRAGWPFASRGRLALLAAYVYRLGSLTRDLPRAVSAYRHASRRAARR